MNLKRKIRRLNIIKYILLITIILLFIYMLSSIVVKISFNEISTSDKYKLTDPVSFLLIGTDYGSNRSGSVEGVRADTVMVATINPKNSRGNIELNLISIPRDTLVYTTCSDTGDVTYDKLTNTMNYGYSKNDNIDDGIACTEKAIENLLNINIDYYVVTSFDGVIDMINAIGGIDVYVPYDFCEQNEDDQGGTDCSEGSYVFEQGMQHLTGEEALSFARQRHMSSDYERNLRQQEVIVATAEKILSDPNAYANDFIRVFLKDFKSNLSSEMLTNFLNFGVTIYNDIFTYVSNDKNVNVDLKSSPYQNTSDYINSSVSFGNISTDNIEAKPIETYYDSSTLEDFENDTYISRVILNKEILKSPSLDKTQKTDSKKNSSTIEFSAYSLASTELTIDGGSYSYVDSESLYYASNLLRTSLNKKEEEPIFDYAAAGLPTDSTNETIGQSSLDSTDMITDQMP